MRPDFWKNCSSVEIVPGRLNGRPVVKGSRVAADTVWECAELGETAEETADNYDLDLRDVLAIRSYFDNHNTDQVLAS